MELPWLMNQIHMHAEQLSERVIQAIRTSPRIKSLGSVSEEDLRRRFFDLFRDLGRWLGEKGEEEIEATYGEIGRRRCREGTPLNELVHAVILVKQELWGYIEKHIAPTSERNLYQEEQIIEMMGKFFDRAVYHTVRGYEEVWAKEASLQLLSGTPSQADSATSGIARAILGELEARRGMIDNDRRLHSVTFTVRLDPPGAVRSLTLQQESHSEGGRRS
jgi:hypothetical protein